MRELTLDDVWPMSKNHTRDYLRGLVDAANIANAYPGHTHLIGDCVLAKLNVLKRKPRKVRKKQP